MDWAEDRDGIRDEDFERVWRYDEQSPATTVVELTSRDEGGPVVHSMKSGKDWTSWLESTEFPSIREEDPPSGIVLILAKRKGEHEFAVPGRTQSNDWLSEYRKEFGLLKSHTTGLTFAPSAAMSSPPQVVPSAPGQRSVRTVPFSEDTFRMISKHFHIHHSISPVVSRADVPAFFSAQVEMDVGRGKTFAADVYHSRTTNAWDMDLALTVTHFTHARLTYAVLFGCPISVEAEVIRRLPRIRHAEASHPLVLAGIFAELERIRHVATVEATIDKLENRISQLDCTNAHVDQRREEEKARQQQEKREDYLDTAYLRNSLISWRNQLGKMLSQAEELEKSQAPPILPSPVPSFHYVRYTAELSSSASSVDSGLQRDEPDDLQDANGRTSKGEGDWMPNSATTRTGRKIIGRLQAIMDEYDDKIRDCSMRLEGMEMATQWAQGETNVEIAMATGRDSKHMRSIAIVTMIFLPGTFLAAGATFLSSRLLPSSIVASSDSVHLLHPVPRSTYGQQDLHVPVLTSIGWTERVFHELLHLVR